jgi:thiol-disulfide isomerase/thioredoxin
MQHVSRPAVLARLKRVAIRTVLTLFATSAAFVGTPSTTWAGTDSNLCADKPVIVKIHADWCGTCKTQGPLWEQINASLGDRATVIDFDVTDRPAYEKSRAEAERLGILEFFDRYKKRTGTIAVLDCKTREPVEVFRGDNDLSKYRDAVARASGAS